MKHFFIKVAAMLAGMALITGALAGCTDNAEKNSDKVTTPNAEKHTQSMADQIELTDFWVKSSDKNMTGAFGIIKNTGKKDIRITSASTDASDMTEMHETTTLPGGERKMRKVEDGYLIQAGEQLELKPGDNHIMIMDMKKPIITGSKVTITFTLDDNSTKKVTATARDFEGNQENYTPQPQQPS